MNGSTMRCILKFEKLPILHPIFIPLATRFVTVEFLYFSDLEAQSFEIASTDEGGVGWPSSVERVELFFDDVNGGE